MNVNDLRKFGKYKKAIYDKTAEVYLLYCKIFGWTIFLIFFLVNNVLFKAFWDPFPFSYVSGTVGLQIMKLKRRLT